MSFTKADLSISTMWNFRKAHSGEELLDQLLALGFERVELNYQVRPEWLEGIVRYVSEGKMKVSSVHNVFPKVFDERFGVDSVLLGYQDEELRRHAVELSKGSIDWACRLGADAVVFHPTEVPMDREIYDDRLKEFIASHRTDCEEYRELQAKMFAARQPGPYLDQMLKSIGELADYVVKNNLPVKLGMENRAMCHQIPIFSEYDLIADHFAGGPVGIWLDTGHAIMMQEMGLQQLPLSKKAADTLVGMHIHDAVDALDHYAPCSLPGDVLAPFKPYIDRCPIKVLELSGRLSAEEILTGTDRFVEKYGR